ncbi:pitrilysin family protein [Ideonella sp. A 288]|uniref:M16 family metallopeptidase n=1 Tax=Ideonella sp. A 288 TaxID=1962181 RepID=UPI0013038A5D|nr:pitrilysin family protein [Ideonella sp. A 288]
MPPALTRRRCLQLGLPLAGALAWPSGAAAAPIGLPPLALRERRLDNGLQVVSAIDRRHPTVAVQVWYRVGAKDDPPGRSGFAHLFEHLMFKSTRHMPNEMFDRLTEDVGGQNNAYTTEDMTAYQSEVPSNHLERLLWAEAERMAHLTVDQANFDSERQVVIEEFREAVLADPYGRLFNALPGLAFQVHPYRRPVIGRIEDLQAASLTDVQHFHRTYYRPDNAVLVVVGDFDPADLDPWVDLHFGGLTSPTQPVPRVAVREPAMATDRVVRLAAPQVPLPAVALLWRGLPASHPDAAALEVAAALLSAGESSRLNETLVYRDQAAQSAGFSADGYADAGLLAAFAIAAGGRSTGSLAEALFGAVRRLAQGPLPAAELDKVRMRLLTQALGARQSPQGQAEAIGRALLLRGHAGDANRALARLQAVGAGDVQRALTRHLLQTRRVTVHYTQGRASGVPA